MSITNVLLANKSELETLSYDAFRTRIKSETAAGNRLVSFFATPSPSAPDQVGELHCVMIKSGRLCHFRSIWSSGTKYQQLTSEVHAIHCFEREVHEQFGLEMPGHPWLKPIRFEGKALKRMNDYPFYKLEGKEVHEVGVGPIHAGVIEPGHFRFMCFGETVEHLEIHLGYQHRGVEAMLPKTSLRKISPLIESIAGDTAVGYTLGFCRAIEALCGLPVADEVESIRGIASELERIAMHLVGLGGLATDVAFLPGSSTYGRIRTAIINLSMRLCGSRFGRSWFRPGELRFPFLQTHRDDIRKTLGQVQKDIAIINKLFQESKTVQHRLKTTGAVPAKLAEEIGLVGMAARASHLNRDVRTELKSGVYAKFPIDLITEPDGDCWSRGMVRLREIDVSIAWIFKVCDSLGDVEAGSRVDYSPRPNSCVVSVEEGWRGEVFHYLETGDKGQLTRYKVQDPSIRNWFGLAQAVKSNAIYDFPICNKSFDLSYCGNDL